MEQDRAIVATRLKRKVPVSFLFCQTKVRFLKIVSQQFRIIYRYRINLYATLLPFLKDGRLFEMVSPNCVKERTGQVVPRPRVELGTNPLHGVTRDA